MLRKSWANIAALALLLVAAAFIIVSGPALRAQNKYWGANYFPNVELTTQDGKTVHFYDDLVKGKIVVIDMIYTHCVDACPLETARLAQVQRILGDRVGKDIFFYSITIDPKRDTPEVLKDYAAKYHVGPGWLFLTGKKEDIDLLGQKLGLASDPNPLDRDGHAPTVLLGNEATGQWMRNAAVDNARFMATIINEWLPDAKIQVPKSQSKPSYADATAINLGSRGRYLFSKSCAACHTIGHGDKIGPDLAGVTKIRDRAWLMRFIEEPEKLLEEGDPIATGLFVKYNKVQMPNLRIGDEHAGYLIDFLADPNLNETSAPQKTGAMKVDPASPAPSSSNQ